MNIKDYLARKAVTQLWGWRGKVLLYLYDNLILKAIEAYEEKNTVELAAMLSGAMLVFEKAMQLYKPKGN